MRKLILFLILMVCGLFNHFQSQNNYVEKGQIDFAILNFENNPVKLTGSWEFYWNQLLTKDQIKNDSVVYWNIEKPWNSYIHNQQKVGAFGCATYRVHIKNLPNKNCDILIKSVLCACKIFINDSLIAEIGKVGYSKEEYTPRWEDRIISIPHNLKNFDLIVQIANYHHRNGGFESPFILGLSEDIKDLKYVNIICNSFITSALIFSGLFFLTIFLFRKKDLSMLFFALYCLINSLRPFFSGDYFIVTIFPNITWQLVIFIEYFTLIAPVIFILYFINEHFKDYSNRNLMHIIAGLLVIEVIILIVFPSDIFTWIVISHEIILIFSIVFITIIIIKALVYKANGAIFAFLSILSLIASAVISILHYTGLVDFLPFSFFFLQILFILMMSLILGSNFSSQFSKVEFLQRYTENQKLLIEEKHKEITDSINYAERIQRSFLATKELLDENLQDYFVFFQPKEVVSGDFYWASELNNNHFAFCCADSTGHGVPGAIMSILNISSLEKAIENETEPHHILNVTRKLIIDRLKKDGSNEGGKDGMDCSLLVLNKDKTQLTFASANNPVFIVRMRSSNTPFQSEESSENETRELLEFKADKMPVGKHDKQKTPFTLQNVSLQKGDVIYTLTDGMPDQFGGDKNKKYMIKNIKAKFLSIAHLPMIEQEKKLMEELTNWKGENEQIDDICIIGVRV
jgi:serine phosphatase RsbU (regulator of sigma subunit)